MVLVLLLLCNKSAQPSGLTASISDLRVVMAQESWPADVFSAQDLTWLMSRVGQGWVSYAARGPSPTQGAVAEFSTS